MKKQNTKNPVRRTHDSFDFNKNEELGCLDDLTYEVRKMKEYYEFIAAGGKGGYTDQDLTIYDYDMALLGERPTGTSQILFSSCIPVITNHPYIVCPDVDSTSFGVAPAV